MEGADIWS